MADVIITGGAGFIGSNLADRLISEGYSIAIIDDLSTGNKDNIPEGTRLHRVDIRGAVIKRVFEIEKPKYLFHLAAQLNVRRSVAEPEFDADVNVLGTINLLQAAKETGVEKIVFTSTGGAIYGEQQQFPADENHPTNPESPYGITKLTGEKYIQFFHKTHGLKYTIFRLANIYGPRQSTIGEAGVVAAFYDRLLAEEEAIINGDGRQTRDFVYVGDVVDALISGLKYPESDIFNIGTGTETTITELFNIIKNSCGSEHKDRYGPAKQGEQFRSVISPQKAKEKIGWEPKTDLKTGIQKTFEYFRDKRRQHTRV
ncbi:MAG: NAD-dependent epimerase/dehydratase family protein [candidate division Zixibacteria bacterium]|nr:NAD-dependent epimerase/dehydratase family protein [candidate division Zixibacteria bacterium]